MKITCRRFSRGGELELEFEEEVDSLESGHKGPPDILLSKDIDSLGHRVYYPIKRVVFEYWEREPGGSADGPEQPSNGLPWGRA